MRRRQREEAHRLTRHQRPTSNAANINPRHLSLPPAGIFLFFVIIAFFFSLSLFFCVYLIVLHV